MMRHKRGEIRFRARKHSAAGILSVLIGAGSASALGTLAWSSGQNGGSSGLSAGIGGVVIFLISACGFLTALYSFRGKDIYYTAPIAGLLLNGVMFAICLGLYMIGFSI